MRLDELVGLCDEWSALAKAGLPLEHPAKRTQDSIPPGDKLLRLADELEQGTPLIEAIQRDATFPPFCAAIIAAGVKSGNLSGLLDSLAARARELMAVRRFIIQATLYPMVVLTILWLSLGAIVDFISPVYSSFTNDVEMTSVPVQVMEWIRKQPNLLACLVAIPLIIAWYMYGIWVYRMKNCTVLNSKSLRWIPWLSEATTLQCKTIFLENLAMLLKHSVPLDQAVDYARASCGADAHEYDRIIRWTEQMQGECLTNGLEEIAAGTRQQAEAAMTKCKLYFPAIIMFFVAVILGFCYVCVVEWPYIQLFHHLSNLFS